jgi:hypothetical protein
MVRGGRKIRFRPLKVRLQYTHPFCTLYPSNFTPTRISRWTGQSPTISTNGRAPRHSTLPATRHLRRRLRALYPAVDHVRFTPLSAARRPSCCPPNAIAPPPAACSCSRRRTCAFSPVLRLPWLPGRQRHGPRSTPPRPQEAAPRFSEATRLRFTHSWPRSSARINAQRFHLLAPLISAIASRTLCC